MKRTSLFIVAMCLVGCNSGSGSAGGSGSEPVNGPPSPQQPAPAPTAVNSTSPLARAPQKVRDQFAKDRPDAKVSKVKGRMSPDGSVHYTITSTDKDGKRHDDEYRADGVLLKSQ